MSLSNSPSSSSIFGMKVNLSYSTSWTVAGKQKNLLTCLAFSPRGTRLIIASKDCNLLLVDVKDGSVLVELSFEGRFSALTGLWYAENNVLIGCCNGNLYDVCFNPTNNKYHVTMNPILNQFNQQIWSLAFEPTRCLLAVGYGNTVGVFLHDNVDRQSESEWSTLEVVKGPCNNESSLVTALVFYPTDKDNRALLIGYAQTGWSIWSKPGVVKRVSPNSNHNICQIGCATLSPDESSVAISTLDRAIVIYTLGSDGPLLESMQEFTYKDNAIANPIVPIAFTPDGLALTGTASGDVPLIQIASGDMSLIHHGNAS
ncbi:hypothetical protein FRC08_009266 [Ceratobasidium sp. 394]|nr:hypothetical protein FRC08_009266 [Ceratobasidium sp. 394]KAG9081777.1 hypothetical protein FS749_007391 [Ceratobasidium sp. UAMH 11750]